MNKLPDRYIEAEEWAQADLLMRFPPELLQIFGKHPKHWNYDKMETLSKLSDWMADKQTVEDETELRKQICKIFNVFPEELIHNLPGGIGLKKCEELETLFNQLLIKAELKGFLTAYDCHDYPRLREYKANLENQLGEKS